MSCKAGNTSHGDPFSRWGREERPAAFPPGVPWTCLLWVLNCAEAPGVGVHWLGRMGALGTWNAVGVVADGVVEGRVRAVDRAIYGEAAQPLGRVGEQASGVEAFPWPWPQELSIYKSQT